MPRNGVRDLLGAAGAATATYAKGESPRTSGTPPAPATWPTTSSEPSAPVTVGRYTVYDEIAAGGMASVHLARSSGDEGFARVAAIKRLHRQFAREPTVAAMLLDEARFTARLRHPNVVTTFDVIKADGELLLVMDYVHGESLAKLLSLCKKRRIRMPASFAATILHDVLEGLHAAHEVRGDDGELLDLVHRDVSPQNVLVGADGIGRLADFGIAKARDQAHVTAEGELRGKLRYMAPEQLRGQPLSRGADIFSAGVVLWEALTGTDLFSRDEVASRIVPGAPQVRPPSAVVPDLPSSIDQVVMRALAPEPATRYATARDLADALAASMRLAPRGEVSALVNALAGEALAIRAARIAEIERAPARVLPAPMTPPAPILAVTDVSRAHAGLPPSARRSRIVIAAAIAALAVIVVVVGWVRRGPTTSVARIATSATATARTDEPSTTPPFAVEAPPASAVEPGAAPSATASAAAARVADGARTATRPVRTPAPRGGRPRAQPSAKPTPASSTGAVDDAFSTRR